MKNKENTSLSKVKYIVVELIIFGLMFLVECLVSQGVLERGMILPNTYVLCTTAGMIVFFIYYIRHIDNREGWIGLGIFGLFALYMFLR